MAKNEIAVNQAPMTGNEIVEPEEQDLLAEMMASISEEEIIEDAPTEGMDANEQVDERDTVGATTEGEQVVEEGAEGVETQGEETSEIPKLPDYLEGIEVGEDTVTIHQERHDDVVLNKQYAQDVVNWVEKKGKADWMKQRVDQMDDDQALAYKTIQSVSDKHKSVQNAPTEQKTFTRDEWAAYERFGESQVGKAIIGAIDKSQGVEEKIKEVKEEKTPEPPKYKESVSKLSQKLVMGLEEGMDGAEMTGLLEEFADNIASTNRGMSAEDMKALIREEMGSVRQEQTQSERSALIDSQNRELSQDPRYLKIVNDVGADGMSSIARLITFGDPITGARLDVKEAFAYVLSTEGGEYGGDSISFDALDAAPKQSSVGATEPELTDEQMQGMTEAEVALSFWK